MKEAAYKGLVRPVLEYGSSVWDPHTHGLQEELEKVQNRAAMFVTGNYVFLKTPAAEGSFDRPAVGWPVEVSLVCKRIVLPKCLRPFPPHAEQIRTP